VTKAKERVSLHTAVNGIDDVGIFKSPAVLIPFVPGIDGRAAEK
jgi:hypothetical protein